VAGAGAHPRLPECRRHGLQERLKFGEQADLALDLKQAAQKGPA
jgi:hypothetical protein